MLSEPEEDNPLPMSSNRHPMNRFDRYKGVKLHSEVFHSAIYACCRSPRDLNPSDREWQAALSFFRLMRRRRLAPTTKTYVALLQVLARTGKVKIAISLLRELQGTPGLRADDKVWGAALNVCAQAADFNEAIRLVNEMNVTGSRPNAYHCSALLNALAKAAKDELALAAFEMMIGQPDPSFSRFYLEPTPPDLVAVNTVMSACSRAGNFKDTKVLFEKLKGGNFFDVQTHKVISPDRISYHCVLASCRCSQTARELIKEVSKDNICICLERTHCLGLTRYAHYFKMRLSRRHRRGAIPPTSVSYAHAISCCRRSKIPDLEGAKLFLKWAREDAIEPTVFMYSSAIWTAERAGNSKIAFELFDEMKSAGCIPNSVVYDALISALSSDGDADRAILMYEDMKRNGLKASPVTFKVSGEIPHRFLRS